MESEAGSPLARTNGMEIPGYCTLCRSRCGTLNTVRDDRLVSVRPNPAHPTGSAMCMKGRAAPELVHSPHRLRYPMRRTRPKDGGDPGWERISWETALTEVAAKLSTIRQENGPEAVAFAVTTPSGTPLSDSIDWIERFIRHFGSPNTCYGTEICNWHKDFAHAFTFGVGMPTPDTKHADLIMLWGHNPAAVWLASANAIGNGRAHGAKMLVVDPRPTALAQQADCWLRVQPGQDAALALGLIRLLIEAGDFDETFVRRWTNGALLIREDNGRFLRERDLDVHAVENRYLTWDNDTRYPRAQTPQMPIEGPLHGSFDIETESGRVRCNTAFTLLMRETAAYTVEHVCTLTSIPPDTLRAAARLIGESKRIAYHAWSGVGQHTNATQTERAIAVLYALTGCFDQVGGNRLYPTHRINPISDKAQLSAAQRAKTLGIDARPLGPPAQGWVTARDTWQTILTGKPYPIRALFGFGANPLASQADTAMAYEALAKVEFHVQCDLFETPTARYADILLPVGTPWEREGLRVGFELDAKSLQRIQLRKQLVPPQGEARSDNDIVFDLACRLGMGEAFFGGSLEAGWNHMLAPLGITVAQLRETPEGIDLPLPEREALYRQRGFDTETGVVELYSERLLRHGQRPLPVFIPPAENAHAGASFPIILSSAKSGYFCHSQHRSVVSLRKRAFHPLIELSSVLAAQQAIEEGDPVIVSTRYGSARFIAKIAAQMQEDVAVAEFGWWQACPEIGAPGFSLQGTENSHFNGLISSEAHDPISGSVAHRSFRCNIVRDPAFDPATRRWQDWRPFIVSAIEPLAEGVLGLHFTPSDGGGLPDFLPGQHISVRAPLDVSASHMETSLVRAYSLTDAAREKGRRAYSIAVRRQQGQDSAGTPWQGAMSTHLHTRIAIGQRVDLRAPGGRFTLPVASPQPVVLIAGGIGITPFISLLETIVRDRAASSSSAADSTARTPPLGDITLHYASRHIEGHAFHARLQTLQAMLPSLTVIDYLGTPRITHHVVSDEQIQARARVYMCGPAAMMQDVRTGLVSRGMPDFDIFHEAFRSPMRPATDQTLSHRIVFRRSKRTEQWHSTSGTLLEFAEKLGISLPSGCRSGQCESCAIRILCGSAQHLHGESPDEPDVLLSCQAIPVTDMELDA